MTSNPSSLTDLKGQVAMSITLGMVLDDGTKESTGGGMMSNNALLGGDEGEEGILLFLSTFVVRFTSYNAPFELSMWPSICVIRLLGGLCYLKLLICIRLTHFLSTHRVDHLRIHLNVEYLLCCIPHSHSLLFQSH